MTKREAKRVGIPLGITALILVPGFFFVSAGSLPMGEVAGMSEAEFIRHYTRFMIVPPEWVKPGPDGLRWSWMKAESIVRLVLVLGAWLVALVFTNPDNWVKGKSNQGLQATR